MPMRIHAILNAKAGTLIDQDKQAFAQTVETGLRAKGNDVTVDLVEPEEIEAALSRAAESDIDVLVAGGGDGTIKGAATRLVGRQTALGIIPLGTLNVLSRDLQIPFDAAQAAAAIGSGQPRAIDVADVNGQIFLCSSLLGLPIRMAEQRQALRGTSLPERIGGYFSMAKDFIANRRRFSIEIDDGNFPRRVRAMSIVISNNPFAKTPSTVPTRNSIDSGQLALYVSKHKHGGAMGMAIARRLAGDWQGDPQIEEVCAGSIVLRSRRSKVRASNDGEIEEFETPLRYRIRPRALNVIMPDTSVS